MTPDETIDLLSVIAAYDQRTVGAADVEAWGEALDDPRTPNLALSECVDAVTLHFRETHERIGPSHILKRVKAQRAEAMTRALPPATPTPGAYAKVQQLLAGRQQQARGECAANRTAVLAFEDLAERLTGRPIGYARPDQWSGYIPPDASNGAHNRSPRREALVALVEEARSRALNTREDTP